MDDESTVKMPGTPPGWVNTAMRTALGVPGLRQLLGKGFAVITVTGARTGTRYSTPVQYLRIDGDYVVLSQRTRTWWRNIRTRAEVDLLVRGALIHCHGTIAEGDHAHDLLTRCLESNPRIARFYDVPSDPVPPRAVDEMLDRIVVLVLEPPRDRAGR